MELLIIGAGAIGSSYGFLASGSQARVSYFVKPKHRADLERGVTLYRWRGRNAETIRFREFEIYDSPETLRAKKFDAVLIALPSDKLRAGDWLEKLVPFIGDAKIWCLPTNMGDVEWIAERIGANPYDRLVWGRIPILSYLAPLPGESFAQTGYAFYLPPGAKALWAAKKPALAEEPAALFSAGGLPSKACKNDFRVGGIFPESLLRVVVAGLERSEWSMDRLVNGEALFLVREGVREASAILAKYYGSVDPSQKAFVKLASTGFGVRAILRIARSVIPFDLEAFFRVHFTKVEGQMHQGLDDLIAMGKRNGLSTTNLTLLRGRVKPSLSSAAGSSTAPASSSTSSPKPL